MPTVSDKRVREVVVDLSAKEVREAIEHAAWCAVVKHDHSIVVEESPPRMMPDGSGGYRVFYTRADDTKAA